MPSYRYVWFISAKTENMNLLTVKETKKRPVLTTYRLSVQSHHRPVQAEKQLSEIQWGKKTLLKFHWSLFLTFRDWS